MDKISVLEAKAHFGQLLERVAQGEEVIITRREKAVARLVPERRAGLAKIREAVARLDALREKIAARTAGKAKLTAADFKAAVTVGRR